MKFNSMAFAGIAVMASPVGAQAISLHPGETITIRFDDGNPIVERTRAAEPISKYEVYVLWRAETQEVPPGAKAIPPIFLQHGEGPPNAPQPQPDRLQITMRRVPGITAEAPENTALFISNGYLSTFDYRASMNANGRSAPTDVCDVPAQMIGLEHWPYGLDELDLSDLRLEPASGTVRCH